MEGRSHLRVGAVERQVGDRKHVARVVEDGRRGVDGDEGGPDGCGELGTVVGDEKHVEGLEMLELRREREEVGISADPDARRDQPAVVAVDLWKEGG